MKLSLPSWKYHTCDQETRLENFRVNPGKRTWGFLLPPQPIPPLSAQHPEEQVPQAALGSLTPHNHSHQEGVRAASLSWRQRLLRGGTQPVWSPGIPLGCSAASTHTSHCDSGQGSREIQPLCTGCGLPLSQAGTINSTACSCSESGVLEKWAKGKMNGLARGQPPAVSGRGGTTSLHSLAQELLQEPWPCGWGSNHRRAKQNSSVYLPEVNE